MQPRQTLALTAYNEYIAAETDPIKKQKARMEVCSDAR